MHCHELVSFWPLYETLCPCAHAICPHPCPSSLFSPSCRLQWRGKLLLVQITNPPRSSGKDVTELHQYVRDIVERVNKRFGSETHQPVYVSELYGLHSLGWLC